MSEPLDNQIYMRLITTQSLRKDEIKEWYQIVKTLAPSGVLNCIQVENATRGRSSALLVCKKLKNGQHVYEIPLTRDLVEQEAEPIVFAWDAYYPEGKFKIESSATQIESTNKRLADAVVLNDQDYRNLCEGLAKQQHLSWTKTKTDRGWRYGLELNTVAKTHPLLRPWEQLSENHKSVDMDLPKLFINLLENYGYAIVKKSDLAKWLQKK